MGRGVAKILAQKGANIVIVARNQQRLAEAVKYISVSGSFMPGISALEDVSPLTFDPGQRERHFQTTLPHHLGRCNQTRGERSNHGRSHQVESRPASGHCMASGRRRPPGPFQRHPDRSPAKPNGHELLGRSLPRSHDSKSLDQTIHRQPECISRTQAIHHDFFRRGPPRRSRLRALLSGQSRHAIPCRHSPI